ncbi:uncharacterized protein LOC108093137 [Drosophila ficusphila]|uniref:uncharacterized protein LOC108093137 n=1 Tax=Drosophila ficusphila TaxID=30025 RepID=UPI001C892C6F|nr:uncharacterized protein LOC108093137 [Drosophila ficusphila]
MKFLIVFVALFALAVAAPSDSQIVRLDSDVQPDKWSSALETSDGTKIDQSGVLKDVGTEHEAAVVHGSYSWVDEKTGEHFTVTYVADENGFQPQGAHLPVAPAFLLWLIGIKLVSADVASKFSIAYTYINRPKIGLSSIVIFDSSTIYNAFNMKFAVVLFALFAVALAAPAEVEIVRQASDVGPENFSYAWETSDGQKADAAGELKNVGSENESLAVRGSFSFVADDGQTYTVNYIADENGFQPQGAHLPVAPEA